MTVILQSGNSGYVIDWLDQPERFDPVFLFSCLRQEISFRRTQQALKPGPAKFFSNPELPADIDSYPFFAQTFSCKSPHPLQLLHSPPSCTIMPHYPEIHILIK
jgi:hypothetical protein